MVENLRVSIFAEMMHFEGIWYVLDINLVPELYEALFFNIECKLQKSIISWTFFMNIISAIQYSCRARGKYFMMIVILDYRLRYIPVYSNNFIHLIGTATNLE